MPSGGASPDSDQQHLASGAARALCHSDMHERDTGIQLVGWMGGRWEENRHSKFLGKSILKGITL